MYKYDHLRSQEMDVCGTGECVCVGGVSYCNGPKFLFEIMNHDILNSQEFFRSERSTGVKIQQLY